PKRSAQQRPGRRAPERWKPMPSNQGLAGRADGSMTLRSRVLRLFEHEDINFLVTNRIPRRLVTQFMVWFSHIVEPLISDATISLWRFFSGLDLSEAKQTRFRSMHDCFIRELKEGARPICDDPGILVSPCDAIVGACGTIAGTDLFQIK